MYTAILRFYCFRGRHLDFRQNDTVDFVGDGTVEKSTPENMGVDTKIMFLSGRIAEIEGVGCKFAPPPPNPHSALHVTKSARPSAVK